jgi:hypothetical protein
METKEKFFWQTIDNGIMQTAAGATYNGSCWRNAIYYYHSKTGCLRQFEFNTYG